MPETKRPMFQTRHYEAIAGVMARLERAGQPNYDTALERIENYLADMLEEDNANFDHTRFYVACHPHE